MKIGETNQNRPRLVILGVLRPESEFSSADLFRLSGGFNFCLRGRGELRALERAAFHLWWRAFGGVKQGFWRMRFRVRIGYTQQVPGKEKSGKRKPRVARDGRVRFNTVRIHDLIRRSRTPSVKSNRIMTSLTRLLCSQPLSVPSLSPSVSDLAPVR